MLALAQAKQPKPQQTLRVLCPAVDVDDYGSLINAPIGYEPEPIALVVLGVGKELPQTRERESLIEVVADKVLYGFLPGRTVRFAAPSFDPDSRPQIWGLVPNQSEGSQEYALRYRCHAREESAQTALAAARLDYHVLAADCIWIGRQTAVDERFEGTVEVVRVLHGSEPKAGEKCIVQLPRSVRAAGQLSKVRNALMLYLATISRRSSGDTFYHVGCRLPSACEADVAAALKRRKLYPIVEKTQGGNRAQCQEVMFRGPIEEAVELLGTETEAARLLGQARLIFEKTAAQAKLAAAVEREMFRQSQQAPSEFRRLHDAIQLLGRIDRETASDSLKALLEKQLAFLATNPHQPPEIKRSEWQREGFDEVQADDVNHSLAWIAASMDEQVVVREFGERLVKLRQTMKERWKEEVQLALDVANVEDSLELAALRKKPTVKAVCSAPRIYHRSGIRAITFSHDGKYLVTAGESGNVFIWNTADWTLAQALDLPGRIRCLVFSADDRWLYVGGTDDSHAIHCRFDWRVGKLDKTYDGHGKAVSHIELSAAGRTMITLGYVDQTVYIWDAQSAKILRTLHCPGFGIVYAPKKNLLLLLRTHGRGGAIVSLGDNPPKQQQVPGEFAAAAFTPDEQFLVTFGDSLELRRVDDGYRIVKQRRIPFKLSPFDVPTICAHEREVAVACASVASAVYSLPDLTPVKQSRPHSPDLGVSNGQIAYSLDGRWRVTTEESRPRPKLFRVATGEELLPFEGHASYVIDLRFSADGRTLRSVGRDGTVCTWSGGDMKMLRRFSIPADHWVASIRPSDGRYALCVIRDAPNTPSKVIDLETGAVLCAVPLETNWNEYMTRLFWLNDSEALSTGDGHWRRFNYRTGQILGNGTVDIEKNNSLWNGRGEATEDGSRLFYAHDGGKRTPPWVAEETVLPALALRKLGKIDTKGNPDGPFGLVPGGKYFHIGMQIFDRHSLKRVATKELAGRGLHAMSFSADGHRYAAAVSKARQSSEGPVQVPGSEKTQGLVRVQETLTGRTLLAIPYSNYIEFSGLSPDGRCLAVAQSNGTIQMWPLPDP
ncbi:MAG TPA: WD40 repeat domain-containing protein [Planctomycetaceae bacterium]|jgi:WD40 repeat protein|nr:WD40 repeat domain-containing protein [Planctomycetaceae bacterium]